MKLQYRYAKAETILLPNGLGPVKTDANGIAEVTDAQAEFLLSGNFNFSRVAGEAPAGPLPSPAPGVSSDHRKAKIDSLLARGVKAGLEAPKAEDMDRVYAMDDNAFASMVKAVERAEKGKK